MALRAVPDHLKFLRFKKALGVPKYAALGCLEGLWHLTARMTPDGNIGKYSVEEIEAWIEWEGAPGALVASLVSTGWIDDHPEYGLIVHDWWNHCDDATHARLARATEFFANGSMPRLTRLAYKERRLIAAKYEEARKALDERTESARRADGVRLKGALPDPVPVPVPEPAAHPVPDSGATAPTTSTGGVVPPAAPEVSQALHLETGAGTPAPRVPSARESQRERAGRMAAERQRRYRERKKEEQRKIAAACGSLKGEPGALKGGRDGQVVVSAEPARVTRAEEVALKLAGFGRHRDLLAERERLAGGAREGGDGQA